MGQRMPKTDDSLTLEDLASLYRVEHKSKLLQKVRPDLYKAIAGLLKGLKAEYERYLSQDLDSPFVDRASANRRKAQRQASKLVEERMAKISKLALRAAMGSDDPLDMLTPEEKAYFDRMLEASKSMYSLLDKLVSGTRYTIPDVTETPAPREESVPAPPADFEVPAPAPAAKEERAPEEIPDDWGEDQAEDAPAPAMEEPAPAPGKAPEKQPAPVPEKEPEIPDDWGEEPVKEEVPAPAPQPATAPRDEEPFVPPIDPDAMDEDDDSDYPDDGLDDLDKMPRREAENEPHQRERALRGIPAVGGDPEPEGPADTEGGLSLVRMLQDFPGEFSGPDRPYVLRKEDIVRLPSLIAKGLVNTGMAAELEISP